MKTLKPSPFQRLKRTIRDNLRHQLDGYLSAPDEENRPPDFNGGVWTVSDSLCLDCLKGAGLMLSIHTRFPHQDGQVEEDPHVTETLNPGLILPESASQ